MAARAKVERIVMAVLTVGCAGLLAWLIIPGRNLRQQDLEFMSAEELRLGRPLTGGDLARIAPFAPGHGTDDSKLKRLQRRRRAQR